MRRRHRLGFNGLFLAYAMSSACAEYLPLVNEPAEELGDNCYLRVQTSREELENGVDLTQKPMELICLDYAPFSPICRDDLLRSDRHSPVYDNLELTCSLEGWDEDRYYEEHFDMPTRDVFRGPFLQNNPLTSLRSIAPLEYRDPTSGQLLDIIAIEEKIEGYELQEGSEFNDRDFVLVDHYRRFRNIDGTREQVDGINLHVSRLTARGQCNRAGILSDIARQAAIGIEDRFSGSRLSAFSPENYKPNFSARWTQRKNDNFIFESEDRAVWASGDYLIEIFFYHDPAHPGWQTFSNPLLVDLLHHAYPSDISIDNYDDMLAALITFESHQKDLLDNVCIPAITLTDHSESGIYDREGNRLDSLEY